MLALALLLASCTGDVGGELGQERIPPSESADIANVISLFERAVAKRDGDGLTRRGAHPKHHGCVHARFNVAPELAPEHQVGLFQRGASYPAIIRFSNNADPQSDHIPDVRGMAIKLLDVPGEKIFQPDADALTHDLLLVSHPVFLFADVATYVQAFAAFAEDRALSFFFNPFDSHIRAFLIVRAMLAEHVDLLAINWFSMVPYRFGADQAVKYTAWPCAPRAAKSSVDNDDNFLAARLREALRAAPACLEFAVQKQRDPRSMPIEDPSIEWSAMNSRPVVLARIEIPVQDFSSRERSEQCENLAFNPWRALAEHRPLGGISRARRAIYAHMSKYRHRRNKLTDAEPRTLGTKTPPLR